MIQYYPYGTLVAWLLRGIADDVYYFVFTGNVTVSDATVLSDISGTGAYIDTVANAAFTLTGETGGIGKITAPDITYTNSGGSPVSLYGYFATDDISGSTPAGNLVACANFDSAPVVVPAGGTINLTPSFAIGTST